MNFKKWMIACMAVLVAGTLFFVADTGHAEAVQMDRVLLERV